MSYNRPSANNEVEQVIKKSLFIGQLCVVENTEQAHEFVARIKKQHPKANHNCHCFIAGSPEQSSLWGYSDDGEPKGCAGLPMFQVIKHSGLGNLCVVVTRYFGGVKLGTGGMARAYSSTVNLVIENIQTQEVHPMIQVMLAAPFAHTGTIEHIISTLEGASITHREWFSLGQNFSLAIEAPCMAQFIESLLPFRHLIETTPALQVLDSPNHNR